MEEKEIILEEQENSSETLEVQTTFNTDGIEVLVDGDECSVENVYSEEVDENANENI